MSMITRVLVFGAILFIPFSESLSMFPFPFPGSGVDSVSPHVSIYHDVINVGVININGKALIIDSGEGDILKVAESLGISDIEWVLYTHFHRDQCAGAGLLKQSGVKLCVPASEEPYFHQATEFWNDYDCYFNNGTNFRPNNLVLRSSVQTDRQLAPGDTFHWQGLTITALGTPGHTDGQLSYMIDIDDKRIIFSGDLIYGPGKIWEFYSLAGKGYGKSFGGAVGSLIHSLQLVKNQDPSILMPRIFQLFAGRKHF